MPVIPAPLPGAESGKIDPQNGGGGSQSLLIGALAGGGTFTPSTPKNGSLMLAHTSESSQ